MIELDLSEVETFFKKFASVYSPQTRLEIMRVVGKRIGAAAESVVSPYPPPSGKPLAVFYNRIGKDGRAFKSKFKTLKQQRKVMALISKGQVPYNRTGKLGQSITSQIETVTTNEVVSEIGSNTEYSPYVIDRDKQSHYHMETWIPLQTDIEKGAPIIAQAGISAFSAEIDKRLR